MKTLLIHAANVHGLGARQMVSHFLKAFLQEWREGKVYLYLPEDSFWNDIPSLANVTVSHEKRAYHKQWQRQKQRLCECLMPRRYYPETDAALILGDIPLRGLKKQLVLVHQSNLFPPTVEPSSERGLGFRIMRQVFRYNRNPKHKYWVQSDVMALGLQKAYGISPRQIVTGPPPPPSLPLANRDNSQEAACLKLIYPAARINYKNHLLFSRMYSVAKGSEPKIQITLTLPSLTEAESQIPWLKNVGLLDRQGIAREYAAADALIFPSLTESFGLPLVEAMSLGLPILAADRPYARWLCEDNALYFDPHSPQSAWQAISRLQEKLGTNWKPDYTKALSKLPSSWSALAQNIKSVLLEMV